MLPYHCPTFRHCTFPSTSGRRCQGWRRCGHLQQTPQRRFGLFRGQSLWMKGCGGCSLWDNHLPAVRRSLVPNTSGRRCQEWRRCVAFQQTPLWPFGLFRGQSLWMEVRSSSADHCLECPTVHRCRIPNTSGRRCQGWRRCGDIQNPPQRPFGPSRGQSLWLRVNIDCLELHHCPTLQSRQIPNISVHRCQG